LGLVRWLHQAGYPPLRINVGPGRVRYVIPDYPDAKYALEALKDERAFMESEFGAKPIVPHLTELRRALTSEPFDILHFACHGEADLNVIQDSRMLLEGRVEDGNYIPEYLAPNAVEHNARLEQKDGNRPLVFLNACQLGRTGYKLTGLGGFARAFLTARAGAFSGALWSVQDRPATIFAQRFYKELHAGANLSDATVRAREEARQQGDASWLSYAVYGHPLSVLKWK
jgi:CHAT domain-containing protein